jgi:ubiquinone/menaquinone biosynthesis C-methylase UbiE
MDLPESDPRLLARTLVQFDWINRLLSRSRSLLRRYILADLRRREEGRAATLLDVGAGSCDLALWLARLCPRLRITCLDHDPRVVAFARRRCAEAPSIEVRLGSAMELEELPDFDYMFANHFLHHIPEKQILPLLQAMCRKTRRLFLVNDLLRSPLSYWAYSLFAFLFLHGSFARFDGRLSIRKGFRKPELQLLADRAGPPGRVQVLTRVPGRICLLGRCGS